MNDGGGLWSTAIKQAPQSNMGVCQENSLKVGGVRVVCKMCKGCDFASYSREDLHFVPRRVSTKLDRVNDHDQVGV